MTKQLGLETGGQTFWHIGTGKFITIAQTVKKADARALAIRYHAYHQAINVEDWNGVIVWGEMLALALDETGIDDLTDTDNLAAMVAVARRKVAAAEAAV